MATAPAAVSANKAELIAIADAVAREKLIDKGDYYAAEHSQLPEKTAKTEKSSKAEKAEAKSAAASAPKK